MTALAAALHALGTAGSMLWQMLWALVLGFALSGFLRTRGSAMRREAAGDR